MTDQTKKNRIAVTGYGFGRVFAKVFQRHPDVEYVGICETNPERIAMAKLEGFTRFHSDFHDVLAGDDYDAVHLALPANNHAKPTIEVLTAGKHCSCAVPMANTLDDLRLIVKAQRESGKNYMMMETMVYTKEFLFIKDMYQKGEVGKLQFLRGVHSHDITNIPDWWYGFPPMLYATHAISPILELAKSRATKVTCQGSGELGKEACERYGNPFPVETMTFEIENHSALGQVLTTRGDTAIVGGELFEIFGSKASFSSLRRDLTRFGKIVPGRPGSLEFSTPELPMRWDMLPDELRTVYEAEGWGTDNVLKWHIDTAMHLVHEFVRSIVENRASAIDAVTAANWCAVGICGHDSALKNGVEIDVPRF